MAFTEPIHPSNIVDLAGEVLAEKSSYTNTLDTFASQGIDYQEVISNRRAAHAYPLNTFQATLRLRSALFDSNAIVAQRLKRLSSIQDKLKRYDWLTLSEMQDVAGCRVIVSSVEQVYALVDKYRPKYAAHELVAINDYIQSPKSDGYRSFHLVYQYGNSNKPVYDGLKIEMQFRSVLQHCWATAVEIADIFYREGLKAHRGSPDWRRFFALMGAAIAMQEGTHHVPRTPRDHQELLSELSEYAAKLDVTNRLNALGETLNIIGEANLRTRGIKYVVLVLDPSVGKEELQLYGFRANGIEEATIQYEQSEMGKSDGGDAVLVSVSDATSLRRAYPNYFLDTTLFVETLNHFIS